MHIIFKSIIIALIVYALYAFIVTVIIYAFKNPLTKDKDKQFLNELTNDQCVNKDKVQLIESEKNGALVRLNIIENATKSIDVAYFTFRDGEISKLMLGGILDAANRGVKIRILLDSLSALPAFVYGDLKNIYYGLNLHDNIELKFYDPINPLLPFNWSKRLHDKMIVVDNNLALIGGRNIADNYYIRKQKGRTFSKDRDVIIYKNKDIKDNESVLTEIINYYNKTWNYKYSKKLKSKPSNRKQKISSLACDELTSKYKAAKKELGTELQKIDWNKNTLLTDNIKFVHNPVGKINQDPWCLRSLLFLASQAKESIFIQSPYIIPTKRIKNNYKQYDLDLTKATILTNSFYSSPNYISIAAYSNHRKKMIKKGVEIFEYQGDTSIHTKTYIFDNKISAIGSFNLDARSSYINSEIMIVIFSEEFAAKLNKHVKLDLDKSLKLNNNLAYNSSEKITEQKVSTIKKITINILAKIAHFIEHVL